MNRPDYGCRPATKCGRPDPVECIDQITVVSSGSKMWETAPTQPSIYRLSRPTLCESSLRSPGLRATPSMHRKLQTLSCYPCPRSYTAPPVPHNLPYLSSHPFSATCPSPIALAVTTRAPASAHRCDTSACGPVPLGCPRCVVPKDLPPWCTGGPRRAEQKMSGDAPCADCRTNARIQRCQTKAKSRSNIARPRPIVDPILHGQGHS